MTRFFSQVILEDATARSSRSTTVQAEAVPGEA